MAPDLQSLYLDESLRMRFELLEKLRYPITSQHLLLADETLESSAEQQTLITEDGSNQYPIRDGIPRFVPESNYVDSFGMQWNKFRKAQLDSHLGHTISADRFWKATGWDPKKMKGSWVLDAGCGAGRFAEIVLSSGANVVALDYSSAANACYLNLKEHSNLRVVQGDIYALPFSPEHF